ncbi:hypothetical protein JCM8202_004270 [Rhodotorula sphaerocarpa]
MSGAPPGSFSLVPILQPLFLGQLLPMYFVGIVLAEVFTYFRSFWGKDRWPLLAFVGFLTGCQLVYSALTVYGLHRWTVVQWGQFAELANISPEVLWANPIISFITLGVQSFFARRIWLLSGREPIVPLVIVAMSLAVFGIGWWEMYAFYTYGLNLSTLDRLRRPSLAILLVSCADDSLITLAIAYYLRRASRGPEGPFLMGPLVKKIIIRTAETNALTSLVLVLGVMCNYVAPAKSYGFILQGLSPELYFLSALVSLNSRNAFRRRRRTTYEFQSTNAAAGQSGTAPTQVQLSKTFSIRRLRSYKKQISGTSIASGVQVTTDVDRDVDESNSFEQQPPLPPKAQLDNAPCTIEMLPVNGGNQ